MNMNVKMNGKNVRVSRERAVEDQRRERGRGCRVVALVRDPPRHPSMGNGTRRALLCLELEQIGVSPQENLLHGQHAEGCTR